MLTLPALPAPLHWLNAPATFAYDAQQLTFTAGGLTDWFVDPAGAMAKMNAPAALFTPPDTAFMLSARVTVAFASTYDAGVLALYERDDCWAKVCFEYSPQRQPMVVSVVTRGTSDDCNSAIIHGQTIWLRLYRNGPALALHYSQDGAYWHFVRHFTLGALAQPGIGFLVQSPTGSSCTATFDAITYRGGTLADLRNGE